MKPTRGWKTSILTEADGGWLPRMNLRSLYNGEAGDRNMTPLLKTTGWLVWSSDVYSSFDAKSFNFKGNFSAWTRRDQSVITGLLRCVPEAMDNFDCMRSLPDDKGLSGSRRWGQWGDKERGV